MSVVCLWCLVWRVLLLIVDRCLVLAVCDVLFVVVVVCCLSCLFCCCLVF